MSELYNTRKENVKRYLNLHPGSTVAQISAGLAIPHQEVRNILVALDHILTKVRPKLQWNEGWKYSLKS